MKRTIAITIPSFEIKAAIFMMQQRRDIEGKLHHNKAPPILMKIAKSYSEGLKSCSEGLKSYSEGLKSYCEGLKSYFEGLHSYFEGLHSYIEGLHNYFEGLMSKLIRFTRKIL